MRLTIPLLWCLFGFETASQRQDADARAIGEVCLDGERNEHEVRAIPDGPADRGSSCADARRSGTAETDRVRQVVSGGPKPERRRSVPDGI